LPFTNAFAGNGKVAAVVAIPAMTRFSIKLRRLLVSFTAADNDDDDDDDDEEEEFNTEHGVLWQTENAVVIRLSFLELIATSVARVK
jgi:hypothetical protein